MKFSKALLCILVFLLIIATCSAAAIDSQVIRYSIVDSKVVVQSILTFPGKITGEISWPIATDAELVEVYLDEEKTPAEIRDSYLEIKFDSTEEVKFSYISEELIDKTNFLLNMPFDYDTGTVKIVLVLPEEAILKKPIKDRTGSIYPLPDKATTDGRSLIFIWEMANVTAGDDFSIFAMYKPKSDYTPLIALLIAAVLILVGYIVYSKFYIKEKLKKAKKEVKIIKVKEPEKEPRILEHLKEDEQQIVRVLKEREGSCEQGTLRVITDFSKAHLSRLLMELEARKIIYKEKRGKKNLVFLK
jgi:uncharacterized membrane protein